MLNINKTDSITFGTTEREVNKRLYSKGHRIMNCNYFVRPYEPTPDEIGDFIATETKKNRNVEMKIWGCSDLSSFIVRKIALLKKIGVNNFEKTFGEIELIDIDKDIIKRARKGLIGVVDRDFTSIKTLCDIDLKKYLKPEKNDTNFFLDGEPEKVSSWIEEEARFEKETIKPYKISPKIMKGLNIRVGDIRSDLAKMPVAQKGTKRIFEFSNSWYFMPPEEHIKLAEKFSTKMNIGDILMIGMVELEDNTDSLLEAFGFKQVDYLMGVFQKCKNFTKAERRNIKKLVTRKYLRK